MLSAPTDGGGTWSKPRKIATARLAPNTCRAFYGCLPNSAERMSNIPVIAVDATAGANAGKLYIVDYAWTGSFMRVQVIASTDSGATWSAPAGVAPPSDRHDQFFPWLNVSANGIVGVTWLDRRNDPSNVKYDAYGAASSNGGASFPNARLTATSSNPADDGFGGTFLGDYTGNAWGGGALIAAWTDTSNGSTGQDVLGGLRP
jgi:hypothetical protein